MSYKNKKSLVSVANNTYSMLQALDSIVPCVEATKEISLAENWLENGISLVAHTNLNSRHGMGVYYIEDLPLWRRYDIISFSMISKYLPRKHEYRISLVDDMVARKEVRVMSKYSRKNNNKIRSNTNSWSWNIAKDVPQQVIDAAVNTLRVLGLTFGSVDIMWNNFRNTAIVMDMNTCEALEGNLNNSFKKGFDKIAGIDEDLYGEDVESSLFDKPKPDPVDWAAHAADFAKVEKAIMLKKKAQKKNLNLAGKPLGWDVNDNL